MGISLAITAEFDAALRRLAWAVVRAAPVLERWAFLSARTPETAKVFSARNFEARFCQTRVVERNWLGFIDGTSDARFSYVGYSRFGACFVVLRVARTEMVPFDEAGDRYNLEEQLHKALIVDEVGGFVAGGHGREAVYVDLALQDLDVGIERISEFVSTLPEQGNATLQFLDVGLKNHVLDLPFRPLSKRN